MWYIVFGDGTFCGGDEGESGCTYQPEDAHSFISLAEAAACVKSNWLPEHVFAVVKSRSPYTLHAVAEAAAASLPDRHVR